MGNSLRVWTMCASTCETYVFETVCLYKTVRMCDICGKQYLHVKVYAFETVCKNIFGSVSEIV